METAGFIALGIAVGIMSGLMGVGGAIFIVPFLVYVLGWEQHMAQGTTLIMLVPPIGILAAWQYYKAGHADIRVALLLCAGFFVGAFFGGKVANALPGETLRRIFGIALLAISVKMIIGK